VESSPFLEVSAGSVAPIVLTCEHATNRLPSSRGLGALEREILASHWGWDIGAWDLARDLARRLRTSAIGGRWSRLLIDLNRRVDDPSLIRRTAGAEELPWNRDVDAKETERRVLAYHSPYHAEVDRLILRRLVRGIRPLVFAVHSFTPEYDGRIRRFDTGVLYERHRGLAHRLGRNLRRAGLSVRYNQPYSGVAGMMYAVDRHGSHHRLPCLELEIRQDLLLERPNVARIGAAVTAGIEEILGVEEANR
jgi:predicted N-formylglutamate amidohydrolase